MSKRSILGLQIHSENHEQAAHFYRQLFNWHFEVVEAFPVTRVTDTGTVQATLAPVHDLHQTGDVDLAVASEDIDSDLAKAQSLGGRVLLPKTETPLQTVIGIIASPDGTKILLLQQPGTDLDLISP